MNKLWIVWSISCLGNLGSLTLLLRRICMAIFLGILLNTHPSRFRCTLTSPHRGLRQNLLVFGYGVLVRVNGSDGAAALVGSLGLVPSLNLSPNLCIGEPVHGSAPDIQGKGIANPIAAIRTAGMMIAQLGWVQEGKLIEAAVRDTLEEGILTPDLGGKNTTEDVTNGVLKRLS